MNAPLDKSALAGERVWLFGRATDLWAFTAPALAAVALVALGRWYGIADGDTPPALWLAAVLGVDVAHVWSTLYRTYADPAELRRRPALYAGAPLLVYCAGVALHAAGGPALFWRVLAYAAVFHFIRQQYGWLALYRRRAGEQGRLGQFIDTSAIYLATIGPLVWWHAMPPRQFHWFVEGDFALGLPRVAGPLALSLELAALLFYVGRAISQAVQRRPVSWGKHLLVGTTALCWWLGIVAFNSDYVFTATNVLIHGIPYMALIWRYGSRRYAGERGAVARLFAFGWPAVYLLLVGIAFAEEGLWDNLVWHDHPEFFGALDGALSGRALTWLVPLLAVPQGVHYLLDAFIWKVGPKNPELARQLELGFSSRGSRLPFLHSAGGEEPLAGEPGRIIAGEE